MVLLGSEPGQLELLESGIGIGKVVRSDNGPGGGHSDNGGGHGAMRTLAAVHSASRAAAM